MDTGLKGKTVLITGATRNHGRASAIAFAAEGANLVLCTRQSMELLEETAELAAVHETRIMTYRCDVTSEVQVQDLIETSLDEFGTIDVVVYNAAWRVRADLSDITPSIWEEALAVNVHAPFLLCKAVLPSMVSQEWGRIINYSGIAPFRGSSGQGTMKMACEGFTRALAKEYGKYNIPANCIGPGSIDVERSSGQENHPGARPGLSEIPIPRTGTVEECAGLVTFLASHQASYITGQTYLVNGGAHFL